MYICRTNIYNMPRTKTIKKPRVPKTRNAGTMTESAFWSFIRSALRQKSRWWKPITQAKLQARRPYKGPNKRQKFEYLCAVWIWVRRFEPAHAHSLPTLASLGKPLFNIAPRASECHFEHLRKNKVQGGSEKRLSSARHNRSLLKIFQPLH